MDKPTFEKDKQGNIVTRPVLGFSSTVVANMAVLLILSCADSPEALEKG